MSLVSLECLPMSQLTDIYEKLKADLMVNSTQDTTEQRNKEIVNLLHEFNDVKDAAQIVIGAIANMEGKTIKEMHMYYNLPLSE